MSVGKIFNLGFAQVTSHRSKDPGVFAQVILQAFKDRHISGSGSFIVTDQRTAVVGIGSDNTESLDL